MIVASRYRLLATGCASLAVLGEGGKGAVMKVATWIVLVGAGLMITCVESVCGASGARDYLNKPEEWYGGPEASRIAGSILSYQSAEGGWPKNVDTTAEPYSGDRAKLKGTFDNGATTDELRFLARVYQARKSPPYREAFVRGLDHILKAQYPSGGWPQYYPPGRQYHRHITFNDGAMARLMEFLREVFASERYGFVDAGRRKSAQVAFDRGIECILRCQIKVEGKLTAWCAQHDEGDYSPRPGRPYEVASISGSESVGIVRLLMSLEEPSAEVIAAVEGAAAWFEAAKLRGIKVVLKEDAKAPKGRNKVVVEDAGAGPLWARFYEIGTNRAMYCDRDGVVTYSLAEIGYERRNGYAWLGDWPAELLAREYPAWKAKRRK